MPWRSGVWPVRSVAWAVQVTAGSTPGSGRIQPRWASACRRGAWGKSRGVRPTALMRTNGGMEELSETEFQPPEPLNGLGHEGVLFRFILRQVGDRKTQEWT